MEVWPHLIDLSEKIKTIFDNNLNRFPINQDIEFPGWTDIYWNSEKIRKCHFKIIDRRSNQKLWLMHVNIFPNINYNLPILGFDIVSGPSKITGTFFDYSPVSDTNDYMSYFDSKTAALDWNKPRDLPEWAQKIFSKNMIAAGNIKDQTELDQLSEICIDLINYYIENLDNTVSDGNTYLKEQNFYCSQQKLNPHLHRSISSMGITEEDKNKYIDKVLFEEL